MIKVNDEFIPIQKRFSNQYNLKKVLDHLGNPEQKIPTINIVGTNGKGSVSFYLSKGLMKKYNKVGLFISPAFLYQNERIQINNQLISDDDLHQYLTKITPLIDNYHLTFFEIWTLIMILYFADQKVDIAVIEAGIGGIKDPTNLMCNQLLTLLTSVSLDHVEVLGNSIDKILEQKVGIAKPNTTLISSFDNIDKFDQIVELAPKVKIIQAQKIADVVEYQQSNKGLVKAAFQFFGIENDSVFNLNPPLGRFTILNKNPYFIIDGAHNQNGIEKLIKSIKKLEQKFIILFASSAEKDYQANLQLLNQNFDNVYVADFVHEKAWDFSLINNQNKVRDWQTFLINHKKENIIVCGSLYFIPQVYEWYLLQNS